MCRDCRAKLVDFHTRCEHCRFRHTQARRRRKATGLCYGCEAKRPAGAKYCARCRAKQAQYNRDQYRTRTCPDCRIRPCEFKKQRCSTCWKIQTLAVQKRLRVRATLRRRALKLEVYTAYGGKCRSCGDSRLDHLCIDHVNDDGYLDRFPSGKRRCGVDLLKRIKREGYPESYQLLCLGCNLAKQVRDPLESFSLLPNPNLTESVFPLRVPVNPLDHEI